MHIFQIHKELHNWQDGGDEPNDSTDPVGTSHGSDPCSEGEDERGEFTDVESTHQQNGRLEQVYLDIVVRHAKRSSIGPAFIYQRYQVRVECEDEESNVAESNVFDESKTDFV